MRRTPRAPFGKTPATNRRTIRIPVKQEMRMCVKQEMRMCVHALACVIRWRNLNLQSFDTGMLTARVMSAQASDLMRMGPRSEAA